MYIREARQNDNEELQQLQARCPQGTALIVSTVNTPDFFARVKAYSDYKVYVVVEDNRIVGSTACALRSAMVNGKEEKVGHVFQAFVDPDYRGRRIAGQMHQVREEYLRQKDAVLGYSLIIGGNVPSMHYISREGFQRHRTLVMPGLAIFKEMPVGSGYKTRTAVIDDLPAVAGLINEAWQDCELYEPKSAEGLQQFITRTPGYNFDNLFLLEEHGNILACLGFWDWSQVIRITVERLNAKMRLVKLFADLACFFWPMPSVPRAGELLKQVVKKPSKIRFPSPLFSWLLQPSVSFPVLACYRWYSDSHLGDMADCLAFLRLSGGVYLENVRTHP